MPLIGKVWPSGWPNSKTDSLKNFIKFSFNKFSQALQFTFLLTVLSVLTLTVTITIYSQGLITEKTWRPLALIPRETVYRIEIWP